MNLLKILIAVIIAVVIIVALERIDDYLGSKKDTARIGKIRYKNLVSENPEMKNNKIKELLKMISDKDLNGISIMIFDERLESVLIQSKSEITDLYNSKKMEKIFEYIEKNDLEDKVALTSFKFKNIDLY